MDSRACINGYDVVRLGYHMGGSTRINKLEKRGPSILSTQSERSQTISVSK